MQSTFGDTLVLVLLFAQLCLGLYSIKVSAGHLDGGVMVMLAEWAQHIVTFRAGAADYVEGVHWVYKAHIFLGLTLVLIAPFTRLVHAVGDADRLPVAAISKWYVVASHAALRSAGVSHGQPATHSPHHRHRLANTGAAEADTITMPTMARAASANRHRAACTCRTRRSARPISPARCNTIGRCARSSHVPMRRVRWWYASCCGWKPSGLVWLTPRRRPGPTRKHASSS